MRTLPSPHLLSHTSAANCPELGSMSGLQNEARRHGDCPRRVSSKPRLRDYRHDIHDFRIRGERGTCEGMTKEKENSCTSGLASRVGCCGLPDHKSSLVYQNSSTDRSVEAQAKNPLLTFFKYCSSSSLMTARDRSGDDPCVKGSNDFSTI